MNEKYEATEEDYKNAELAAHKIAPLFQMFGWTWSERITKHGTFGPYGSGYEQYVPNVRQIADEFVRLIEQVNDGTGYSITVETGRLGVRKTSEGVNLYLAL